MSMDVRFQHVSGGGKPYANMIYDCGYCEHALEIEDGRVTCGA